MSRERIAMSLTNPSRTSGLIWSIPRLYFFLISPTGNSHRFLIRWHLFVWSLQSKERGRPMFDLGLLVSGLAFFAVSIGYALACDRL
jgi:hypothetical protein